MKGIKEIFIFLVIGILLVFIDNFSQNDRNKIPVDDQLLTQLSQAFEIQFDRKPNDEELTNLLISWYEDEILYQEALTKGFDSDDEIVRRRLIQKYNDFLRTQAFSYEPTEEELRNFYEENLAMYMEPFNISFTHKFYRDKDSSEEDIFFSGDSFIGVTEIKVNSNFGEGFFQKILEKEDKRISSTYGWHKINDLKIYPEKIKSFEIVRDNVLNDFMLAHNAELYEANLLKIKDKYELIFNQ